MKVLIVNGSSHVNGTTMQAVQEVEKVFHDVRKQNSDFKI